MATGRPYRSDGSIMKNDSKFLLQRCDPGVGKINPESFWAFEGHIISINDNSSPSWSPVQDSGRGDPKVMYSQYQRSLEIQFLVMATNDKEHRENYKQLDALGRMTYPIYKSGLGYNGSHVYYKIDQLVAGYGVITNLAYTWDDATPWVINRPLYTNISISIMVLADMFGKRPDANKSVYLFKKPDEK